MMDTLLFALSVALNACGVMMLYRWIGEAASWWLRTQVRRSGPDAEWRATWHALIEQEMATPPPLTGDPDVDYQRVHWL